MKQSMTQGFLAALLVGALAACAAGDPAALPADRAGASDPKAHAAQPDLLGAEWLIEDIAGGGVVADSQASLQFLAEGRLAGNASCNRLIGSYTRDGAGLSVKLVGTTMMACPPALMQQEQALLKILPDVARYLIDASGTLVLSSGDGKAVVRARRK